ncbi:MAG: 30S ribosomal protein S6e [Methanocellales archaeon]
MVEFRVVISDPKTGKARQVVVSGAKATKFIGKQIGSEIDGEVLGLIGYKLIITGGSDRDGLPMRKDLPGGKKYRVLLAGGTGYHPDKEGKRDRKGLRGREITLDIGQINMKIVEYGPKTIEELLGEEEIKVEKKEEKKVEKKG